VSLHSLLRGQLYLFYMYMMFVPHSKHVQATKTCYGDSFIFLSLALWEQNKLRGSCDLVTALILRVTIAGRSNTTVVAAAIWKLGGARLNLLAASVCFLLGLISNLEERGIRPWEWQGSPTVTLPHHSQDRTLPDECFCGSTVRARHNGRVLATS
jgi:hypothetical protein